MDLNYSTEVGIPVVAIFFYSSLHPHKQAGEMDFLKILLSHDSHFSSK